MSRAAKSLAAFGVYLLGMGVWLVWAPNSLLRLFGMPGTDEVWIRVVGTLALLLAFYYLSAARSDLTRFIQWTVYARAVVIGFFGAFVALGMVPATLLLFGVIDLLAAAWTEVALRTDAAAAMG